VMFVWLVCGAIVVAIGVYIAYRQSLGTPPSPIIASIGKATSSSPPPPPQPHPTIPSKYIGTWKADDGSKIVVSSNGTIIHAKDGWYENAYTLHSQGPDPGTCPNRDPLNTWCRKATPPRDVLLPALPNVVTVTPGSMMFNGMTFHKDGFSGTVTSTAVLAGRWVFQHSTLTPTPDSALDIQVDPDGTTYLMTANIRGGYTPEDTSNSHFALSDGKLLYVEPHAISVAGDILTSFNGIQYRKQ
jgi:hypothetical protein